MITALAELGKTQRIQIIPDYDDAGNVTVTVLFAPKKEDGQAITPIQYSGPIAEVEAHIGGGFDADVKRLSGLVTNIAEVEAELEKEKKEAEAKKKKPDDKKPDETEPKKNAKPTDNIPAKEVKPRYRKGGKVTAPPAEPPASEVEPAAEAAAPEAPATDAPSAEAAASELTEELGDLFGETPPATTTTTDTPENK